MAGISLFIKRGFKTFTEKVYSSGDRAINLADFSFVVSLLIILPSSSLRDMMYLVASSLR